MVVQDQVLYHIEHLRKVYRMGEVEVPAIRDITLDVYEGEFLVILGPSGSGKSTLLNIIGGMDSPSSGTVFFGDRDITKYGDSELTYYRRNHIGFVFQFYNLIPNLTALENVEVATELSQDHFTAAEALELVDLNERLHHFPSQLSGGEQQRVSIARAVAKRPEILLCDEPTGALDYQTGKIILRVLKDINAKTRTTVVIITHNVAIGDIGNRCIRLKDGTVRDIKINDHPLEPEEIEW